ncbi:hypothetical protein HDV05_008276, partial [Chytridiales sp. JEL 0842]
MEESRDAADDDNDLLQGDWGLNEWDESDYSDSVYSRQSGSSDESDPYTQSIGEEDFMLRGETGWLHQKCVDDYDNAYYPFGSAEDIWLARWFEGIPSRKVNELLSFIRSTTTDLPKGTHLAAVGDKLREVIRRCHLMPVFCKGECARDYGGYKQYVLNKYIDGDSWVRYQLNNDKDNDFNKH